MRHWQLVLLASLALFGSAPAGAQAPDANTDLGANAALKYWQAFGLLPAMDKNQQKILEQWNKAPIDAAALKLIEKSTASLLYLHRATKLQHCDWSLDYQDGVNLLMPHLGKARTLASLAALHARHEFAQGHWKAGAEDIIALLELARNLETDPPPIIQHLVGYAIETVAIQTAAPYLPELKSVLADPASAVLNRLGKRVNLAQMVLKEKQIGAQWFIGELKKAERHKEGSWQDVWKHVLGAPAEGERVDQELAKSARTFEQAVKILEDLLPWYDELARVTALPWKEFDRQYPVFVKKAKAANPLAGYVLPHMGHVAASQRRAQTQRALFQAALAVVQGGQDKLRDIQDPYGDGPFEYRALDRGFELRSRLIVRGQPLTLTVGQGKE
jgi:hypothetical protein